ncbi:hypothetical protein L6452_32701 [Arctium lappa]|uniref:Uncharacterized protein n=1 Tax=Arctium lappa TaxID=4217 RepID=A0ACB8Z675_ARCLA|nr:hypothetical protein L6452_32701 [Arctium lappa]
MASTFVLIIRGLGLSIVLVSMANDGVPAVDQIAEKGEGGDLEPNPNSSVHASSVHEPIGPIVDEGCGPIQGFRDTQSKTTSVFDRLSMPKGNELQFGNVTILQRENGTKETYASKLQSNGPNAGVENEAPKGKRESDKLKDVTPNFPTVEPMVEGTKPTADPSRGVVHDLVKGDFLDSMCKAFTNTKAKRGWLNTTPFSVLIDLDEEGSNLHGLHGDDEVGNTIMDVETQVSGESGTPLNASS